MARTFCFAGIDRGRVAPLTAVMHRAGLPAEALTASLNVADLGAVKPGLLLCDLDRVKVEPLELLRQLRFVLPDCIIVVYTGTMKRSWSVGCHLAGANGLLAKHSSPAELVAGIRGVIHNGSFTDPRFAAA